MDAILVLVISNVLRCYFLQFFEVSLTWVVFVGLERKRISIPETDFYFLVNNSKLRQT